MGDPSWPGVVRPAGRPERRRRSGPAPAVAIAASTVATTSSARRTRETRTPREEATSSPRTSASSSRPNIIAMGNNTATAMPTGAASAQVLALRDPASQAAARPASVTSPITSSQATTELAAAATPTPIRTTLLASTTPRWIDSRPTIKVASSPPSIAANGRPTCSADAGDVAAAGSRQDDHADRGRRGARVHADDVRAGQRVARQGLQERTRDGEGDPDQQSGRDAGQAELDDDQPGPALAGAEQRFEDLVRRELRSTKA